MRKILFLAGCLMIVAGAGCSSDSGNNEPEEELQVTLYDREKEAIAYIDGEDNFTIYTFEGEPLAYVEAEEWVYGFNGKLLGWYVDGVLYDRSYYAVGAKQGIVRGGINTVVTRPEKRKNNKQLKPVKHVPEAPLVHLLLKDSWSETTLSEFLDKGKK